MLTLEQAVQRLWPFVVVDDARASDRQHLVPGGARRGIRAWP